MTTRGGVALLLILMGSACREEAEPVRNRSNEARAPAPGQVAGPSGSTSGATTSQPVIESWNGIERHRDSSCDPCCRFVFPAAFGASNPTELMLLREIATGEGRAAGLACGGTYRDQGFEQLRELAIRRQDRAAALLVLHANSVGGIDLLGGYLAEDFGVTYMVPVLERYIALDGLLTPEMEAHVAGMVCGAPHGVPNLDRIVSVVARRGARSLSKRLADECAKTLRELKERSRTSAPPWG